MKYDSISTYFLGVPIYVQCSELGSFTELDIRNILHEKD